MGVKDGKAAEAVVELVDTFDPSTGFTAMQRLTGWHASIVAILAAKGKLEHGAIPIELAVPGNVIVDEAKRRGLQIEAKG
jgi:lysine 6-dehydrogenase